MGGLGSALGDQFFHETAILEGRDDPPQQTPRSPRRLPGADKPEGTFIVDRKDDPIAVL